MTIKRGEIYWVNFDPTIGSEIKKRRPALIISNDIANNYSPLVTVIPITSKVTTPYPFEAVLEIGEGGLKSKSLAKANQVRTVDKQRIIGPAMGAPVSATALGNVEQALRVHLGL